MATKGQYAAFASLPSLSGPLGASASAGADVARDINPAHLLTQVPSQASGSTSPLQATFDLAREVISEHELWQKSQQEEQDRKQAVKLERARAEEERKRIRDEKFPPWNCPKCTFRHEGEKALLTHCEMCGAEREKAVSSSPTPAAEPVATATATPAPASATPAAATPVAVAQVTAVPVAPRPDEVTLIFHFPDGKQVPSNFKISQGGFDVYAKAFELGGQQQPTAMQLKGPRGSPTVDREMDEGSWSFNLTGLGVKATQTYDIDIEW